MGQFSYTRATQSSHSCLSAVRILEDLKKKGLIRVDEKVYALTETGVDVENKIRSLR